MKEKLLQFFTSKTSQSIYISVATAAMCEEENYVL